MLSGNSMQVLRWLLTVPAGILGLYLGFFAGILIHYGHVWACPNEHLVSGACMAPWSLFVKTTSVGLSAAIAAAGVVLLPTLLAPSHRWLVARIAFACGLLLALYLSLAVRWVMWIPVVCAILSGVGMLWLVRRHMDSSASSLDRTRESSTPIR